MHQVMMIEISDVKKIRGPKGWRQDLCTTKTSMNSAGKPN